METLTKQNMDNEEQTTNESSQSSGQTKPKSSSMRLVVMGVVLTAMVVMALIQSGARSARDEAAEKVGRLMDSDDYTMPADYMKAVGKTARIVTGKDKLTQVYRWNGVLQHFELRIEFIGSEGDYIIKDIKKHSYYLKPGDKRRAKQALARKRTRKKQRREVE